MAPLSAIDFVSKALLTTCEASISELRQMPELTGMGALEAVREIDRICSEANIECSPSLRTGELDDPRVFSAIRSSGRLLGALEDARRAGEGHLVEFKQTLGLHVKRLANNANAQPSDLFSQEIIHEVIKTIVSFLNADGGTLVIGLCDDGTPYGIENEFAYIGGNKNIDEWELRLQNALSSMIFDYRLLVGYLSIQTIRLPECHVCVVAVEPRHDRIAACRKAGSDDEIAYRRSGNSTLRLQARDIEALVLDRVRLR